MYKFSAVMARMKYISRWGLMRNARVETLAEHAQDTAVTASILGAVSKAVFGQDVNPQKLAAAALYHDCSEIITGDMPTPAKYRMRALTQEYKKLERQSVESIVALLPDEISGELNGMVTGDALNDRERLLLKAADKISALVKCIEEERSGNTEFCSARVTIENQIRELELDEVDYYVDNFLPAHSLDLDRLFSE